MNISTVNELIQSLESAGELSIKETKVMALAKAYLDVAAENKRLTDVAQGGAFVMQKALMKYEFGVGMTMQAEDFIRDAREKHPATDRIVAGIKADGVEMFALMFAEEAIKDNNITTGWKARASRAASEYAELLREGAK
ncbi:hypothetical protein [Klebsiella michiganensis]|uniref:hypothetical protein n=1 Tax=Klebsiella michiganensis TaxID=1134687 RepID=UPI00374B54E0